MHRFLQQCEREVLHRSGAILPHGTLLVADEHGRVANYAANFSTLSGLEPIELGQPVPDLLLDMMPLAQQEGARRIKQVETCMGVFDVAAIRNGDGHVVIELTKWEEASADFASSDFQISSPDEETLKCHALCDSIRIASGFDRVLYYRFRDDEDGEVIAESCREPTLGRYLGLRFPASDIPRIARSLYLKNPWRQIPDSRAEPVEIIGDSAPDLTYSDLRSVSPIHRIYLANMGVVAALSFPISNGNSLKALITCHHASPRMLGIGVLQKISESVRRHAHALATYQASRRMTFIDGLDRHFDSARKIIAVHHGDALAAWKDLGPLFCKEFQADGAMICMNGACEAHGESLEQDALSIVENWFLSRHAELVMTIENLSREIPDFPLSNIAGLLAVKACKARIYIFRIEHVHEVAWGGNPDKPVEFHESNLWISPRRSFEKWIEKRIGYCRPWNNESKLMLLKLRELFTHA